MAILKMILLLFSVVFLLATLSESQKTETMVQGTLKIEKLHIRSDITYRFASTVVTSTVRNPRQTAQEMFINLELPPEAFITNFTMVIDGKLYSGVVKAKTAAKKQYDKAKKKGQSAGHIKAVAKNPERFMISVNVEASASIDFELTYEELLQRQLSVYQHVINLNLGQTVKDFKIDVYISESRPLVNVNVLPLQHGHWVNRVLLDQNPVASISHPSPTSAHVTYAPTVAQQIEASVIMATGISGKFVVTYDVERTGNSGELLVVNGYFVHFLAPKLEKPLPKRIIFVLDVSSSMSGVKIRQMHDSMLSILSDLRETDEFNIILFSSGVKFWRRELVSATKENVKIAKEFIRKLRANGWTNMNRGLGDGVQFLAERVASGHGKTSIMMFLTDGQPSTGITAPAQILANVRSRNEGGIAIFSLAFGTDADFELVKKVSAQNDGFARKIYEASDATLQMKGFYDEISTPLLTNATIRYIGDSVDTDSVTTGTFRNFFEGSEIVLAGKLKDDEVLTLNLFLNGEDANGDFVLNEIVNIFTPDQAKVASPEKIQTFTEKLWAYLTIKQLMKQWMQTTDPAMVAEIKKKALTMSLKYGFVTPLTSMVVTLPQDDEPDTITPKPRVTTVRPSRSRGSGRSSGGSGSFADSDPHFVVQVKGLSYPVCFDVTGHTGQIFQLIADPHTGVYVNGKVFGTTIFHKKIGLRYRTYFGTIAIMYRKIRMIIGTTKIRIDKTSLAWRNEAVLHFDDVIFRVNAHNNITVDIGDGIQLTIIRHRRKKMKVQFLGVYIQKGDGFSKKVGGLIGEFEVKRITEDRLNDVDGRKQARLRVHRQHGSGESVHTWLGSRRNMAENKHYYCWHLRHGGDHVLDYQKKHYSLKKITSKSNSQIQ